jgi:hypothetical protein
MSRSSQGLGFCRITPRFNERHRRGSGSPLLGDVMRWAESRRDETLLLAWEIPAPGLLCSAPSLKPSGMMPLPMLEQIICQKCLTGIALFSSI